MICLSHHLCKTESGFLWFNTRSLECGNIETNVKKDFVPICFFPSPQNATIYLFLHILTHIWGHAMVYTALWCRDWNLWNKHVPACEVWLAAMCIKKHLQWIQPCHSQASWLHEKCRTGMDIYKESIILVEQTGNGFYLVVSKPCILHIVVLECPERKVSNPSILVRKKFLIVFFSSLNFIYFKLFFYGF